jgi:hypothetical protein
MRIARLIIGCIALLLVAACAEISTTPYVTDNLDQAQAACNAGNGAACNTANRLRSEAFYRL